MFKANFNEKLFRSVTILVFIFGQICKFKTEHNSHKNRIKLSCEFASIFIFHFLFLKATLTVLFSHDFYNMIYVFIWKQIRIICYGNSLT